MMQLLMSLQEDFINTTNLKLFDTIQRLDTEGL